jgi:hypothetical protein
MNHHQLRAYRRDRACQLRQLGYSYRQIGAALGCSHEQARIITAGMRQPERITGLDGRNRLATRAVKHDN